MVLIPRPWGLYAGKGGKRMFFDPWDEKVKRYFEAVLVCEEIGDLDVVACKTLAQAKKTLKKMIGERPFHDAYIREFEFQEWCSDYEPTRDYDWPIE